MKALSVYLILVGSIWALGIIWMYLVSGISEPMWITVIPFAGLFLIWPLMLIVGSILVLGAWHAKAGAILTMIGCAILTVFAAYQSIQDLHVQPLQVKPPYVIDVFLALVTLLADFAAFWLYRMVSVANASWQSY